MIPIEQVLKDEPLRREVEKSVSLGQPLPKGEAWNVTAAMVERVIDPAAPSAPGTRPFTEAVIREYARPVLLVKNNRIELPVSEEWRNRLLPVQPRLEARLPSVGRIEFTGHPRLRWGGTGWMIAQDVIVTNRHVAAEVARRNGDGIPFRFSFSGDPMECRIDFREEFTAEGSTPESFEVAVNRVLFLEQDDGQSPDVAFLQLVHHDKLPSPIPISNGTLADRADIAVVGYPARDPRGVASAAAAHRIFGDIYEVKRFAPGQIMIANLSNSVFTHDATTLGGNSGSVVIELTNAGAVGLHFGGELTEANYAVNAQTLLDYLANLQLKSFPVTPLALPTRVEFVEERTPADYADREGFDEGFLGPGNRVEPPLPDDASDVLEFEENGATTSELKYTHFSVAMSKSRRLCLWSAVNIDGDSKKSRRRPGWLFDPRIPTEAQTEGEVYGNPPHFARGHMTRREDPIWGSAAEAKAGNGDSMHRTNAVPQWQPFNAGIWLGLEDYALENAVEDQMRISVITGPVLSEDDPEKFGEQIPLEFWKVIAFIHDESGGLTATGYIMSQESFISAQEFVYGAHKTYQVPIKVIERKARISFGTLAQVDPLKDLQEGPADELTSFEQIQFVTAA
jgi:endonuclease G